MATIPIWIDCEYGTKLGYVGYLVETFNSNTGGTSWSLYERPLHTTKSHEPRLEGWCGEENNRSRFARGVVRIVLVNTRGDRALIARVTGEDLVSFLESDGYPELGPSAAYGRVKEAERALEKAQEEYAGAVEAAKAAEAEGTKE